MSAARIWGVGLLLVAGLILPATARGGIVVQSRSSSVSASIVINQTTGELQTQSAQTTGFGTFSKSVSEATNVAQAFADQTSSLTFTGGDLTGAKVMSDVSTGSDGSADSDFDLAFLVTGKPAHFTLAGSAGGGGPSGGLGWATFTDLTRGVALDFVSGNDSPGSNSALNDAGTLAPGRYQLKLVASGGGNGGGQADATLTLSQGATAVPLPAAAWSGMATVLVAGAWAVCHRRRASARV